MPVIMKDNVQYAYTTKGTVFHTLSNAEYEALSEEEKMNGDVYCIPDREPVINPDQLWEKVGTGTLDIGSDLTDGVNQLNSSLSDINTTLGNKANLESPTFTGTPKAPTASSSTNNTQIATTAFVNSVVDDKIIYRDVTIASISVAAGSVQTPSITLPSVSGYSIVGATVRSAAGAGNGQLIILPRVSNNFVTIYNPTSSSMTATNVSIRYILVKN